jgi:hypothetical protein
MNLMPPKVIEKKVYLWVRGFYGLSKEKNKIK